VAVVLAGGLGTRVAALTEPGTPKALLPVAGEPFLAWKLRQLANLGVARVVVLTGHGAPAIHDVVGDGSRFGLRAECVDDGPRLLGTGGAIRAALARLPEMFWVTYGDSLVEAPLGPVEDGLAPALGGIMTVLRNEDRGGTSNVDIADGLVTRYSKQAPAGTFAWIDYGLLLLRATSVSAVEQVEFDLSVIIDRLVCDHRLGAYEVTQAFHDIGTVDAFRATDAWLAAGGLSGPHTAPGAGNQ
jgi:N-acetyl-alpha-D-muramate 1-phosphate uridylyltransferase